jgi:prevent-host-death family protein
MRGITATELRQRLGEMLDAASAGESILIERDHRPLAYLVSYEDGQRLTGTTDEQLRRRLEALDGLVEIGRQWRRDHGQEWDEPSSVEAVRWDRDHRDDEKYERSFGDEARTARQSPQEPETR